MYLSIQFRRNLQYVFGNKSGTGIKRIFTEITKRTNKKQSVSFSFCLDKTYHPLWLMKLHHRRHLAQCLSPCNFRHIRRFYKGELISGLQDASGAGTGAPVPPDALVSPEQWHLYKGEILPLQGFTYFIIWNI